MTIGIGLLVDTLIVRRSDPIDRRRAGRWFWWPLNTFRTAGKKDPEPEPEPEDATAHYRSDDGVKRTDTPSATWCNASVAS